MSAKHNPESAENENLKDKNFQGNLIEPIDLENDNEEL